MNEAFTLAYKLLNSAQKQAVDAIDGPVMVIAGPGTGKTQILTLRIANILKKTDTQADGILCLTFTKSGADTMRRRLRTYIGGEAGKIEINTFHSFGMKIIEEFYTVIGLPDAPSTLEDADTISLFDHILNTHEWEYLRPRGNGAMYYRDLRSLISLLKRERLSPQDFALEIEKEISMLRDDKASIASRGESKGQLKKEVVHKIESLERTREVVKFYELYEEAKHEKAMMDYDDILAYMVAIVRESEDARAELRERYLYVLVDEHQDSSGVQNEFLELVWGSLESPNVFVVGDDRQLIYGFGGASLSHFESFQKTFTGTEVITLIENYRSTQAILDTADNLLSSSLAVGKLKSQNSSGDPVELVACTYPRDEIIRAGLFFKEKIAAGTPAEECALLLPKNTQVRNAVAILRDMGLPASSRQSLRLFDTPAFQSFITILKIINDPFSSVCIAEAVLDPVSGIPQYDAHVFLHGTKSYKLSIDSLIGTNQAAGGLFADTNLISLFGKKLALSVNDVAGKSVYEIVQIVGNRFFLSSESVDTENAEQNIDHDTYVKQIEVVRSMLHLATALEEKVSKVKLTDYLAFIERLQEYGEHIPLAVFGANEGIQVMTLHTSKGQEFEAVWIAHMNERSLMGGKRSGFALPESLKKHIEKKDEETAKRELYVALTRAKTFCVLSYAKLSHKGGDELLASIIESMPEGSFVFTSSEKVESAMLAVDPLIFVQSKASTAPPLTLSQLRTLVSEEYLSTKVSVTLLNSFFDCPWKWYFRNFLRVPEPLSESLQFGSIVHSAIESVINYTIANDGNQPQKNDITHFITQAIEKNHVVDESTIKRFSKEANLAVTSFVLNALPNLWLTRESEKALSYHEPSVPELLITGKIDLLESDGGEDVRVTDFKTGGTKSKRDIEKVDDENRLSDYMRQLAMYSYLIENTQKGRHHVVSSRLYFVEEADAKKALCETVIGSEHIESLIRDIKDYDALMKSGEWTDRPCHFKGWGGETECPYCKRGKMYK